MTRTETAALLGIVAAFDNRKATPEALTVWADSLSGIGFDEAKQAVRDHFAETTDWLMPAHIHRRVRAWRADQAASARSAEVLAEHRQIAARPRDPNRSLMREAAAALGVELPELTEAERHQALYPRRFAHKSHQTAVQARKPADGEARDGTPAGRFAFDFHVNRHPTPDPQCPHPACKTRLTQPNRPPGHPDNGPALQGPQKSAQRLDVTEPPAEEDL